MPTVTPSHVFADDQIPSAAEWNSNPNTFANALNGNLDSDNIDLTGAFAWTGAHTFGAAVSITGSGASSVTNTTAAGSGVVEGMVIATNPGSGTPADNDGVKITFKGDDDGGNATTFGEIQSVFTDVSNGSEDGSLVFRVMTAGSLATALTATGVGVGVGTEDPDGLLHVYSGSGTLTAASTADDLIIQGDTNHGISIIAETNAILNFGGDGDNQKGYLSYNHAADLLTIATNNSAGQLVLGAGSAAEAMRIDATGNVGIGAASFGVSAAGVLAIANGTQGGALANAIQIVSEDLSAGNTIPSIRTEGSGIYSAGTPAVATGSIALKVNGTVYHLTASTTAAS